MQAGEGQGHVEAVTGHTMLGTNTSKTGGKAAWNLLRATLMPGTVRDLIYICLFRVDSILSCKISSFLTGTLYNGRFEHALW